MYSLLEKITLRKHYRELYQKRYEKQLYEDVITFIKTNHPYITYTDEFVLKHSQVDAPMLVLTKIAAITHNTYSRRPTIHRTPKIHGNV